eukprot:TRINITY_DN4553_c2_g1_i10.p1 TRINITY_DN4553_c2_g1~~TRINITY_DN4553_c2_g1_i10.p1  ORF type:complete len:308 (+),score=35.45 TRINITY_DN4553_c2_g1_i10:1732-2655(+)
MTDELLALEVNKTWDLVPLPENTTIIGSKWVYSIKHRSNGSIDRYKARLVAQGYKQEYGIDYEETFAPVAKMTTVRCLLAVAASRNCPLWQMDVKNAFLHGDLKEVVYMRPPPGYSCPPHHVCKSTKSLYGLKQAPRAWFEKFRSAILQAHFYQSSNDSSLFIRRSSHGYTILLIYVDDMIISGNDHDGIDELKTHLMSTFKMKDLGSLTYFLGLEVQQNKDGIQITQSKYVDDLIHSARLGDAKTFATPIELNVKLSKDDGHPLPDPTIFRRLVGSLLYLTMTRPDISHAVQAVSQFIGHPHKPHL